MRSYVVPTLFFATLILLSLLGHCIVGSTAYGMEQKPTQSDAVAPISSYESARRIVGLSLSRCWTELGENPNQFGKGTWDVSTESYLRCTIKNIQAIELQEVGEREDAK